MWKIEVEKDGVTTHHEWANHCCDDFARFIPSSFGVDESAVKFYTLDDLEYKEYSDLSGQLDGNGDALHTVDYSETGKIKVKLVADDSLVYTLSGAACLWASMYDENMNFLNPNKPEI